MDKNLLRASIEKHTRLSFSRSSGKGGQNVNKLNTKVHAELSIARIEGLSEAETLLLRKKMRANSDDALFIDVQDERTQERNREIALDRLEQKICAACAIQKKRKKTKPSAASKERRLKSKKIHSLLKQTRQDIA